MVMKFYLSTKSYEEYTHRIELQGEECIVWEHTQVNDNGTSWVSDNCTVSKLGGRYLINVFYYDKHGKVINRWHTNVSGILKAFQTAISRIS